MQSDLPFSDVLALLEEHGWHFQRIDPPYRVFLKEGELPIFFPVHDKKVSVAYVKKIKKILGIQGQGQNG